MVSALVIVGLVVAVFVGFNIGGSSTGVAFGPAVGSKLVRKFTAGILFTAFAFVGAWTVGRNVINTMSGGIVPAAEFSPVAAVGVLFFTGAALLVSNLYGVPASTSMTAVGAIVGLGLATGTLNEELMFTIVSAWIVAPLIGFGAGAIIGRYVYPRLEARLAFTRLQEQLVQLDRSGPIPRPRLNGNASSRDVVGSFLVLSIACYMGFSAGASNAANAVAPLVGNGSIGINDGILLAVAAIGLGGFTIARRTLATVGDLASGEEQPIPEPGEKPEPVTPIGEEDLEELTKESLFDPAATSKIVVLWVLTPSLAVVASYLLFSLLL